ncbi:MAG: hypothetical protein KC449_02655, partial [Anaerolineales bacterium]|nr:hypothetical protein [Anaerolineales bacterium]
MDVVDPIEVELAQEAIDDFCRQFGAPGSHLYQAYRDFARHAALPLTFTADLLYRLQERFRRDMRGHALHIPWVAVADLMLSHLCHQVRPETFRLDEQVQDVLLAELQEDRERFWSEDGRSSRLQEVANFLISYAAHQMNHPSHYVREAAKAERLNAQVIINPEWVRQSLQETAVTLQPQQDPVATLRLASLVNSFNRSVSLTRDETDPTRQDFNKLRAYTAGQALLAEGKAVTAVSQQFQTAFGSDSNIQIGGQPLPSLGELTGQPTQPTLSASLGVAFAGDEITIVLEKGETLPATSKPITLIGSGAKLSLGLGYFVVQLYQGSPTNINENIFLGEITIDHENLYSGDIELEVTVIANIDNTIHLQLSHESGFARELTVTQVDTAQTKLPQIVDFREMIERQTLGVRENAHIRTLTAVSNWLDITDSARSMIPNKEQDASKTISTDPTRQKLTLLRKLLIQHFSLDELQVLCFDLGLDYEELPGDTRTTKMHDLIEYLQRRGELTRLLTKVTEQRNFVNWPTFSTTALGTTAERTFILTGERGLGKTTIAALLTQYFRGDRQPPNKLYALAPTSTNAVYFCQPSHPETLDPRSFALTIASQWASRDSNFAYLQSIIDNHEEYALDELVERLLIKPFIENSESVDPNSIIFLVDDLEAALQYSGDTTIVDVILRMLREVYGVRFLLTAQMQTAVRDKLANIKAQIYELPPYFAPIFNFSPALNAMPTAVPGFTELLPAVDAWLTSPEAPQHGGVFPEQISGKSAAMANLIKYSQGLLPLPPELTTRLTAVQPGFIAAYHLYQSTDPRTMNPRCFIQSIAIQLANKYPAYNAALRQTIENFANELAAQKAPAEFRLDDDELGEDHPQLNIVNQMGVLEAVKQLLIQPWQSISQREPVLILIDGLDEMLAYAGATNIPLLLNEAPLPAFLRLFLAANENSDIVNMLADLRIQNFRWEQFEGERPSGTRRPDSKFMQDMTIPDDSLIQPGETFDKIWQLRNTGTQKWSEGFRLTFVEGEPMTTTLSQPIFPIQPGEELRISISLTAPTQSGSHVSVWRLQDDRDIFFGDHVWAKIVVDETAVPPEPTPAPTYDNFDIWVGEADDRGRHPVTAESVENSAWTTKVKWQQLDSILGDSVQILTQFNDLFSKPSEAVKLGKRLFEFLFPEEVLDLFEQVRQDAEKRGKSRLRVRVKFVDSNLQRLPWELCHDGRSFIFNNPDQPILLTRTVGLDTVQTPPPLPRPVRLLVAIAAPTDQGHIDVYDQEKMIHFATEELVTSSELDYQIIQHTTLRELESTVQSFQPNIVHFIGHSSSEKEGSLVLENMSSLSNLVPVSEI